MYIQSIILHSHITCTLQVNPPPPPLPYISQFGLLFWNNITERASANSCFSTILKTASLLRWIFETRSISVKTSIRSRRADWSTHTVDPCSTPVRCASKVVNSQPWREAKEQASFKEYLSTATHLWKRPSHELRDPEEVANAPEDWLLEVTDLWTRASREVRAPRGRCQSSRGLTSGSNWRLEATFTRAMSP